MGRLPGTTVYRNVRQYASAKQIDGMLLVRVDAPLFFANVGPVADALRLYEKQYHQAAAAPFRGDSGEGTAAAGAEAVAGGPRSPLRAIVLDLSPVSDMDASAVHFLASYVRQTRARGVDVALANPSCQVAKQMARARLDALVGRDRVYVRVGDAVDDLRNALPLAVAAKEEDEKSDDTAREEKKRGRGGVGDEKV